MVRVNDGLPEKPDPVSSKSNGSSEEKPQVLGQVESFLTFVHVRQRVRISELGLIEGEPLRELCRLMEPKTGRFGYPLQEREVPLLFFVDTLCRACGMVRLEDFHLKTSQYGYLYLARPAERRHTMLLSAFVKDYPWHFLFPRGAIAKQLEENKLDALRFLLGREAGEMTPISEFSTGLAGRLGFNPGTQPKPYPKYITEWTIRHAFLQPLSVLGVLTLLNGKGGKVMNVKTAEALAISERGSQLLRRREIGLTEGDSGSLSERPVEKA